MNIWDKAQTVQLQVAEHIKPEFDLGFDKQITADTKEELKRFVRWVENHYHIPITLWVDFEYRHYLVLRNGQRVGYIFYWADFPDYPVFDNAEEIPVIRLPVRTEHSTMEEILGSFIEAISDYFAWICNEIGAYDASDSDTEEILQKYLNDSKCNV